MQSARNKEDILTMFLNEVSCDFDIIMMSETWYANDNDVIRIPRYKAFFLNRTDSRGGGVAMYMKENFDCEILEDLSYLSCHIEILTVKNNDQMFSIVYRPPQGSVGEFLRSFDRVLCYASDNRLKSCVGGDFNIDIASETSSKREFCSVLEAAGFRNYITEPTRITPHSATVLDLLATNHGREPLAFGRVMADISDHLPVFLVANREPETKIKRGSLARRVQTITPEALVTFKEKRMRKSWYGALNFIDEYTVGASYSKKQSYPEQRGKLGLHLRLIKTKNGICVRFIKSRNLDAFSEFKAFRNTLNNTVKRAEKVL